MAATTDDIGYWAQVRREAGGDLVSAAIYLFAYLAAPWLSDAWLTGLVVGVALQFFVLTPLLGAITPRGPRRIALLVVAHLALFALLAWISSGGGAREPLWLSCALAQSPLVLRNLARLRRPAWEDGHWILEAIGPFLLLLPVIPITAALAAILPDLGLATRELRFDVLAPLPPDDLKFALLAGMVYFGGAGLARVAFDRLGGKEHRREDVTPAMVRRWREAYRKSRAGGE